MAAPGPSALIDRVDPEDRPIGRIARRDALVAGANFRTAHVFVFDRADRLLLQRLAPTRDRSPGLWGSSVAGYLFAGEDYEDAAMRRMMDELCLRVPLIEAGKMRMRDEGSIKFVGLYLSSTAEDPEICDPDEIAELRFWPVPELTHTLRVQRSAFTPTFSALFSFWQARGEPRPPA